MSEDTEQMNEKTDLLPCPFCGGTNIERAYIGSGDWTYECHGCEFEATFYVSAPEGEQALADAKWNGRAGTPEDRETLLRAADLIEANCKTIFGKSVPSYERIAAKLREMAGP